MKRRQFVKTMGAVGLASIYSNTTGAEASAIPHARGARSQAGAPQPDDTAINDQIRREKFDTVLPEAMKKNNVDMWIYVVRDDPDLFGAQDFGSTSGVFVFTDRGGNRIERAILGRRWGASFAAGTWPVTWDTRTVETCGAYDIIEPAVLVKEPSGTMPRRWSTTFALTTSKSWCKNATQSASLSTSSSLLALMRLRRSQ